MDLPEFPDDERIGFLKREDLVFVLTHYVDRAKGLLTRSESSSSAEGNLEIAQEAFYLQRFIGDATFFGYEPVSEAISESLKQNLGDSEVLTSIFEKGIKRFAGSKTGYYKIGENGYVIYQGEIFYKTLKGKWYQIDEKDVFLLLPKLSQRVVEEDLTNILERYDRPDLYSEIYDYWQKNMHGNDLDSLLIVKEGETTPDRYTEEVVSQIKKIVDSSISFDKLDKCHEEGEHYLESVVKVSCKLIEFVETILQSGTTPLYLLRDGIMFSEAQTALDFVLNRKTSNSQIMINRKLLSRKEGDEYFWALSADSLYSALRKCHDNFETFYDFYKLEMKQLRENNPEFDAIVKRLADYAKQQLAPVIELAKSIIVVDTGLQGSINMLTKYILDECLKMDKPVDIRMFVVGDWLKGIYKGKYHSNYYPMMKDIEIFNRSEHLYGYKAGSFEAGQLKVIMGKRDKQILANIELITLATVCKIIKEK